MSNQYHHQVASLLETEVDRREFLSYCGATLLGILGISGLIKVLKQPPKSQPSHQHPGGYGVSTYGGN